MAKTFSDLTREEQDILDSLDQANSEIDHSFENRLEAQFIERVEKGHRLLSGNKFSFHSLMEGLNRQLIFGSITMVTVFALTVGVYFLIRPYIDQNQGGNQELTLEDILIKATRAGNLWSYKQNALAANTLDSTISSSELRDSYRYNDNVNIFYTTSVSYTPGPAFDNCPSSQYPPIGIATEEYSAGYDASEGNYRNLSIVKDADGNYISYTLILDNEDYQYFGGEYVIKNIYSYYMGVPRAWGMETDTTISEADEGEPTNLIYREGDDSYKDIVEENPDDLMYSYFGPDSKLIGEEKVLDRATYLIEWSSLGLCYDASKIDYASSKISSTPDGSRTSVTRAWIDKETFQILKTEDYVDRYASENLVGTRISMSDGRKATLAEVEQDFVYDLDSSLPIKEVVHSSLGEEESLNFAIKYAQDENLPILLPANEAYRVNSAYSSELYNNPMAQLSQQREFFAPGAVGDYLYQLYVPSNKTGAVNLFRAGSSTLDWSQSYYFEYFKPVAHDKLVTNYATEHYTWVDSASIAIGSNSVSAKRYVYVNEETVYNTEPMPGSRDQTEPFDPGTDSPPSIKQFEYSYYIFDYSGFTVMVYTQGTIPALRELRMSSTSDEAIMRVMIEEMNISSGDMVVEDWPIAY